MDTVGAANVVADGMAAPFAGGIADMKVAGGGRRAGASVPSRSR